MSYESSHPPFRAEIAAHTFFWGEFWNVTFQSHATSFSKLFNESCKRFLRGSRPNSPPNGFYDGLIAAKYSSLRPSFPPTDLYPLQGGGRPSIRLSRPRIDRPFSSIANRAIVNGLVYSLTRPIISSSWDPTFHDFPGIPLEIRIAFNFNNFTAMDVYIYI